MGYAAKLGSSGGSSLEIKGYRYSSVANKNQSIAMQFDMDKPDILFLCKIEADGRYTYPSVARVYNNRTLFTAVGSNWAISNFATNGYGTPTTLQTIENYHTAYCYVAGAQYGYPSYDYTLYCVKGDIIL